MNICGNNNSYNRSSHFRQVAGLVMKLNRGLITINEAEQEIKDVFVKMDADSIINWIKEHPGESFPTSFAVPTIKIEASNSLLLKNNPFDGSISRYYSKFGGNAKTDAEDLQHKMNSELVFRLVYNPILKKVINPNSPSIYYGYTEINWRLRKFKESLVNDVISKFNLKTPEYNFENDTEFTIFTNTVIRDALSVLNTRNLMGESISKDDLDAFVKLAQFDELLLNSNIVKINEGEETNGILTKNRYSFTGETVYTRSMYDEHADVKDYTSKLVTCILDSISWSDSNGVDIDIKIGLDGFNYAMHHVNSWFNKLNLAGKENYSYKSKIDLFLLKSGSLSSNLRKILLGIKKNLFEDDVPEDIQNLFAAQADTSVQSSYVEYAFDNIKIDATQKNIPGVSYRKIHDRMEDQAKINLAKQLTTNLRRWQNLKSDERDILRKNIVGFSISKKENGIIECSNNRITLVFTPSNKGYTVDKSGINSTNNSDIAKLVNELFQLPVLDENEVNNALGEGYTLLDHFDQMIAIACAALTGDFSRVMLNNNISFVKSFDFVAPAVNFIQRLTVNETHIVTKDQHGNTVPSNQLVSFGYRIQNLIDEIQKDKDHVQYENIFTKGSNRSVITDISLRQSVKIGNTIRDVESMTFNENEQLKVVSDFFQHLLRANTVTLQTMTYSDKTRHLLYEIAVDRLNIGQTNPKKASELLKSLAKSFMFDENGKINHTVRDSEKQFFEHIRMVREKQLEKSLTSIVSRFTEALGISVYGELDKQIQQINDFIKGKPISWLQRQFRSKNIDLYLENDIDVNKKDKTIVGINPALTGMYDTILSEDHSSNYFNYMKYQYLKTLKDKGFKLSSVYDPSLTSIYFNTLDRNVSSRWINSQSGNMSLGFIRSKNGSILTEYTEKDIVNGDVIVELNPMFNSYFWCMNLFGEQLRSLTMGLDQNIAGNGISLDDSIHSRFIAHTKRAMGQGSTVMKYHPQKFGIAKEMDACVYDDVTAPTFNPKGEGKDELAFDGGGHISPIEFIMEQWSLPGKVNLRGDVIKSIIQFVDKRGALNQIKWAATTLSNFRRRGNLFSDTLDLNVMFKKMHNANISLNFNIEKYYSQNLFKSGDKIITCNEDLYFYDINTGKHYKILSVTSDPLNNANVAIRTIIETDIFGNVINNASEIQQQIQINNIADLHELYGGIYCKTLNQSSKELEYSEINNEVVANIVCNENLKNKFTAYAICKSAFKVGMHNVNESNIFSPTNNSDLWKIKVDLSHSGVQLDAGHEVSEGHVSEGSQMISLVTESGFATDIVQELYDQIASVTNEGLSKFNDESKIKSILSKILDDSLNSGTSNVTSITDDFIKHLKIKAKEEGVELELYFSSPSIRSKFSTAVCASINRLALRRKFAGLGAVQTPSYDQMTTSRIGGFNLTSEDLCDEYRDSLNGRPISYLFNDPNSFDLNVLTAEYIADLMTIKSKSDKTPVIEELESYNGYVRNVDFEDTIVYFDGEKYIAEKIKDIKTYDKFRHSTQQLYRWNTRPRNLVQQLSYFDVFDSVNGGAYKITIYDFDEYRLTAYLSEYLKGKTLDPNVIEFINSKGISLQSDLKSVIKEQQKILQEKLINIGNALKRGNTYELSPDVIITGHENSGAEIMIGNPWLEQFGLKKSDSLYKILKDPNFFNKRLKDFYLKVDEVTKTGYDAILYTSTGEPILIQFGSELYNAERLSNLRQGDSLTKIGNSLVYNGEELGSSIGFSDYVLPVSGGKTYKVWRISDPSRLNNLMKKKMFDHVIYNMSSKSNLKHLLSNLYPNRIQNGIVIEPIRIGKRIIKANTRLEGHKIPNEIFEEIISEFNDIQEDRFNSKLRDLARQRTIAFKKLLTCIGTRIPSQALSSVAKCKIVGFTGSSSNDVYLPRVLTWVAGSDYDIDKFYIMMSEVLSNGTLPNLYVNNSSFDPIELSKIKKLVTKDQKEIEIAISTTFDPNATDTYQLGEYGINSLLNGDHTILEDIVLAINAGKQITLLVDPSNINLSPEAKLINEMLGSAGLVITDITDTNARQNAWSVENLINEFITSDPSKYAQKYREIAERNVVVDDLTRILSEPATQIALQSVVSADEGKRVADVMDLKYNSGSKDKFNFDNPACITSQQIANMVGKIGIAATAVAKKAYDGIAFSFNMTILDIAANVNKNGYISEEDLKKLKSLIIPTKDGSVISIASVDFKPLIQAVLQAGIGDITVVIDQKEKGFVSYLLSNLLTILNASTSRTNAVDYYSTMMTLATDNAKELVLARLNAVGENIDLYTYMFATGKTFEEAADIMRSPVFTLVQKLLEKNVFQAGNERIRLHNVIGFLNGTSHLPTVNVYMLRDIMLGWADENDLRTKSTLLAILAEKHSKDFCEAFGVNSISEYFSNRSKRLDKTSSSLIPEERWLINIMKNDLEAREMFKELISKQTEQSSVFDEFDESMYDYDTDVYNAQFSSLLYSGNSKQPFDVQKKILIDYIDNMFDVFDQLDNIVVNNPDRFAKKSINDELSELLDYTAKANEFATLGRKIFRINQGMPVGDYEEWNWSKTIENAINSEFVNATEKTVDPYGRVIESPISFIPLDWNKFLNDNAYADLMIEQYDKVKHTVNILRIAKNNKHMLAMLKGANVARKLVETSKTTKLIHNIAQNIFSPDNTILSFGSINSENEWNYKGKERKQIVRTLTKQEYKSIASAVNEHLIFGFFNHLPDFEINFTNPMTGGYKIENNMLKKDEKMSIQTIRLNTISGMMNFKKWMDTIIFPAIKNNQSFAKLSNALQIDEQYNKEWNFSKFEWTINSDIANAKPGDSLYNKKSEILNEFSKLARTKASDYTTITTDITIGDLLYLYNLMVHKDSRGLTFLFSDLAASKNTSDWINRFQQYVKDVDYDKIQASGSNLFNVKPTDVIFNVVNGENSWKFLNANKIEDVHKAWRINGVDYMINKYVFDSNAPFNIPSVYDLGFIEWTGFELNSGQTVHISDGEITHELIANLNSMLMGSGIIINEVDNFILNQHRSEKSHMFENVSDDEAERIMNANGFVFDGNVYVNTDKMNNDRSIIIHELMHLVCANLHYNPKFAQTYHKIINDLWWNASEEDRIKYTSKYPNKKSSDLREEYFVDKIANLINRGFNEQLEPKLGGLKTDAQLKEDIFTSMKDVFSLEIDANVSLESFLPRFTSTYLKDAVQLFKSGLFNFNANGFTSTTVNLSQELATLRNRLIDDGEIIEECK